MKATAVFPILLAAAGLAGCASTGTHSSRGLQVKTVSVPGASGVATLYGGAGNEFLRNMHCGASGCSLYASTSGSFTPDQDFLVIHTQPFGEPLWARAYGGTDGDALHAAIAATDGGALLVGASASQFYQVYFRGMYKQHRSFPRPLVLRIGPQGKIRWALAGLLDMSGPTWRTRLGAGIQTADGGFVLAGFRRDWPGSGLYRGWLGRSYGVWHAWQFRKWTGRASRDAILLRVDKNGTWKWVRRYRLTAEGRAHQSEARQVLPRPGGNFVAALYDRTADRVVLMRITATGKPIGARILEGLGKSRPVALQALENGGYLLFGRAFGSGGALFVARLERGGTLQRVRRYDEADLVPMHVAASASLDGYCVAGRGGPPKQPRFAALLIHLNKPSGKSLSLDTDKASGFLSAAALQGGQCLLAGNTTAFGAGKTDIVTYPWQPALAGRGGPTAEAVADARLEPIGVSTIKFRVRHYFGRQRILKSVSPDSIRITPARILPAVGGADDRSAQSTR